MTIFSVLNKPIGLKLRKIRKFTEVGDYINSQLRCYII